MRLWLEMVEKKSLAGRDDKERAILSFLFLLALRATTDTSPRSSAFESQKRRTQSLPRFHWCCASSPRRRATRPIVLYLGNIEALGGRWRALAAICAVPLGLLKVTAYRDVRRCQESPRNAKSR